MTRVTLDEWELAEIRFALKGRAEDGAYTVAEEGGEMQPDEVKKAERLLRKIDRAWRRA